MNQLAEQQPVTFQTNFVKANLVALNQTNNLVGQTVN